MGLTVYWTQLAENKLEDIFNYYKTTANSQIARKLIHEIVSKTEGLEEHPRMGQKEGLLAGRSQDFRYLVCKNYKIIYWINEQENRVDIANVFDCRQSPDKIIEEAEQ